MLHVVSHHALAVICLYHTFSFSLLACDYSKHFSRQVGGKQRRSVHLQTLGSASLNYVRSLTLRKLKRNEILFQLKTCRDSEENTRKLFFKTFNIKVSDCAAYM